MKMEIQILQSILYVKENNMKKLLLYLIRWQLSTPILALCLYVLDCNELYKTIIANFIGGLIFYNVDKYIFRR